MITRDNYEIWFIDYADGTLNADEKAMVEAFILNNPDLEAEFDALELTVFPVNEDIYKEKTSLKRNENEQFIYEGNVEEFVVLELDNELNHKSQKELNDYLLRNPQYAHLRTMYSHTILPLETIVYHEKESLKRKTGVIRPLWYSLPVAAAASIALFLIFGQSGNDSIDSNFSSTNQTKTTTETVIDPLANQTTLQSVINSVEKKKEDDSSNSEKKTPYPNQKQNRTPILQQQRVIFNESVAYNKPQETKHDENVRQDSAFQPKQLAPSELNDVSQQIAGTITDPGNEDNPKDNNLGLRENPAYRESVTRQSGIVDLGKKETWYALAEKGLSKVSGKPTEIVSEKTDEKKSFKLKIGGFEVSRSKHR